MKRWKFVACIILPLFFALLCLLFLLDDRQQAGMPIPMQVQFQGEYSYDGTTWYPLTKETKLSAGKEELWVKGEFGLELEGACMLNVYCEHIGVSVFVNGEPKYLDTPSELLLHGKELIPAVCGVRWEHVNISSLEKQDEVEIHFMKCHSFGNENAFQKALSSLCFTPDVTDVLTSYLKPYIRPLEYVGYGVILVAAMLLGAALYAFVLKNKSSWGLFLLGMTAVFAGGYILLDVMEVYLLSVPLVWRTYGGQISRILAVYFAGLFLTMVLTGRRRWPAAAVMLLSGAVNVILLVFASFGHVLLYDLLGYWAATQLIVCPVMIVCSIWELLKGEHRGRINPVCAVFFFSAVLLDIAGMGETGYNQGLCVKITFVFLLLMYLLRTVKQVMTEHQATLKNKQLQKELENNRITLMLSQIQPHFLYNSLTAVMDLCDSNPKQAKAAIADFADYLRGNLASLKNEHPIPFEKELEHIEKYLRLEKLRFREELQVRYNIPVKDFLLPSLSIQPLVENAVKHGVGQKKGGGTVVVETGETEDCFTVCVSDTGVGFDKNEYENDGKLHTGIENIRKRLELVNAGLEISSKKGEGTVVWVRIPKEIK